MEYNKTVENLTAKLAIENAKLKEENGRLKENYEMIKSNYKRLERLNKQLRIYRSNWSLLNEWRINELDKDPMAKGLINMGVQMRDLEIALYKEMEGK